MLQFGVPLLAWKWWFPLQRNRHLIWSCEVRQHFAMISGKIWISSLVSQHLVVSRSSSPPSFCCYLLLAWQGFCCMSWVTHGKQVLATTDSWKVYNGFDFLQFLISHAVFQPCFVLLGLRFCWVVFVRWLS